jgi:exodeoxyribonuclease VII small subunit
MNASLPPPSNPPITVHEIMAESQTPPADFERSLTELEALVEKLEQGDLSLDESLKCFERGVQLTRVCQTALKQAEQKVEILLRRSGDPEQFDRTDFDNDTDDEA